MRQDNNSRKDRCEGTPKGSWEWISPFFEGELDEMTEEDRKKYRSIVSRKWKEIREDPARLSVYNDRPRQMKNEAEKTTKLGDDSLVSRTKQHEKTMAERSAAKQPQKAPKTQEFVNTDSDDSRTCGKMASKNPQSLFMQTQVLHCYYL